MTSEAVENVSLPKDLCDKIRRRMQGSDFRSIEEYVVFVLEQVVADEREKPVYTPEEEKKIEQRLRDLGYVG